MAMGIPVLMIVLIGAWPRGSLSDNGVVKPLPAGVTPMVTVTALQASRRLHEATPAPATRSPSELGALRVLSSPVAKTRSLTQAAFELIGDGWCRPDGCDISQSTCRSNGFYKDSSSEKECAAACDDEPSCIGYAISLDTYTAAPAKCFIYTTAGVATPNHWTGYAQNFFSISESSKDVGVSCHRKLCGEFTTAESCPIGRCSWSGTSCLAALYDRIGDGWCRPDGCDISESTCRSNGFYKDSSSEKECAAACNRYSQCIGYAISLDTYTSAPAKCFIYTTAAGVTPNHWMAFTQNIFGISKSSNDIGVSCHRRLCGAFRTAESCQIGCSWNETAQSCQAFVPVEAVVTGQLRVPVSDVDVIMHNVAEKSKFEIAIRAAINMTLANQLYVHAELIKVALTSGSRILAAAKPDIRRLNAGIINADYTINIPASSNLDAQTIVSTIDAVDVSTIKIDLETQLMKANSSVTSIDMNITRPQLTISIPVPTPAPAILTSAPTPTPTPAPTPIPPSPMFLQPHTSAVRQEPPELSKASHTVAMFSFVPMAVAAICFVVC